MSVRVTPRTTWTFARVAADDGAQGWREGTLEGRSHEVESEIHAFDARLRGREITPPIDLGPAPDALVNAAAHSAVDQALWDLVARAADRPLAALLGGGMPGSRGYQSSCMHFFKSLADSVNESEFLESPRFENDRTVGQIAFHHNMIVVTKDLAPRSSNVALQDNAVRSALMKPSASK